MNRCFRGFWALRAARAVLALRAFCALSTVAALTWSAPGVAQVAGQQEFVGRQFPAKALRGILLVTTPPQVLLDGRPDRLSPGARIRDADNSFVMSANVVGQRLVVNFTRDASNLIHEVWLLTPEEAARKANLATPYRNFNFESEGNQPARDDGKTPFHLLPKFPQR
jgi:hypothetical protein